MKYLPGVVLAAFMSVLIGVFAYLYYLEGKCEHKGGVMVNELCIDKRVVLK